VLSLWGFPFPARQQAQVSLVNERRGVEGLSRLLLGELLRRQFAELVIDERQQLTGGVRITLFDGFQDPRHVAHDAHRGKPDHGKG